MIALGHGYAKSRIHKGRLNPVNQIKSLFTICHITLQLQTQNVLQLEKEAFTIFYALQQSDQYLCDFEFIIRTAHKPLKYIMDSHYRTKDSTLDHTHLWLQL